MEEKKDFKTLVTVKNVIRVLSLLALIFAFCPSFLVSCGGEDVNINVMTAVKGVEDYVNPYPIMLACILIPIVFLAISFIKQLGEKKTTIIMLVCVAIDIVLWIVFCTKTKAFAEKFYCEFKVLPWYIFNLIALILILLATILTLLKAWQLDTNLIAFFTGEQKKDALNQMASAIKEMSASISTISQNVVATTGNKDVSDKIGYCNKCGKILRYGNKFCTSCGTPIPESVLVEAEKSRKVEVEPAQNVDVADNNGDVAQSVDDIQGENEGEN